MPINIRNSSDIIFSKFMFTKKPLKIKINPITGKVQLIEGKIGFYLTEIWPVLFMLLIQVRCEASKAA
ncbi:MAG: hypothetical protein EA394_09775, partial [Bacteroidia bacterium]